PASTSREPAHYAHRRADRPDRRRWATLSLARHELECRGSRFWARDVVDNAVNAAPVTILRATEPRGPAPIDGSHVEVVAVADDPDRHRPPQRAVASRRCDLQLVCSTDLAELFARPPAHGLTMTLIASRS